MRAVPEVVRIVGPPGSGKSSYAKKQTGLVIDLDDIKSRLAGCPPHMAGDKWTAPALAERNRILESLADKNYVAVWFIIGSPKVGDRR